MAAELQEGMQNMLRGAFGQNPVGKLESVDIGARMSELGLAQWLPDEARCICVAVYVAGRVCVLSVACAGLAGWVGRQRVENKAQVECQRRLG